MWDALTQLLIRSPLRVVTLVVILAVYLFAFIATVAELGVPYSLEVTLASGCLLLSMLIFFLVDRLKTREEHMARLRRLTPHEKETLQEHFRRKMRSFNNFRNQYASLVQAGIVEELPGIGVTDWAWDAILKSPELIDLKPEDIGADAET